MSPPSEADSELFEPTGPEGVGGVAASDAGGGGSFGADKRDVAPSGVPPPTPNSRSSDSPDEFWREISGWARKLSVTQKELAEGGGISESVVSRWKSGKKHPSRADVSRMTYAIAKAHESHRNAEPSREDSYRAPADLESLLVSLLNAAGYSPQQRRTRSTTWEILMSSATRADRKIKVGWFPWHGLISMGDGRPTGPVYEMIESIVPLFGCVPDWQGSSKVANIGEELRSGQVDIVLPALRLPSRGIDGVFSSPLGPIFGVNGVVSAEELKKELERQSSGEAMNRRRGRGIGLLTADRVQLVSTNSESGRSLAELFAREAWSSSRAVTRDVEVLGDGDDEIVDGWSRVLREPRSAAGKLRCFVTDEASCKHALKADVRAAVAIPIESSGRPHPPDSSSQAIDKIQKPFRIPVSILVRREDTDLLAAINESIAICQGTTPWNKWTSEAMGDEARPEASPDQERSR